MSKQTGSADSFSKPKQEKAENEKKAKEDEEKKEVVNQDFPNKPTSDVNSKPPEEANKKSSVEGQKKPSEVEAKKPSEEEAKKPSVEEPKKPSIEEPKKPSIVESKKPSIVESKKPSAVDEPNKASPEAEMKSTVEEPKKASDSPKKPKDPKKEKILAKLKDRKEKKEKEFEERKKKRTEEMAKLSKVKGPKSLTDEVQIERAGYQVIRSETVFTGKMANIYKAKKKKTESELCVKLIILDRLPKPYRDHLMEKALKIISYVGSGGDQKAPKCERFVRVFDVFLVQNKVFVFMEQFLTLSVYTRIKTKDTITEFEAKKWGKQLAEAIDCLQVSAIAHRNIRTENVIFDKKYDIKLVGFASAVVFWDEKTQQAITQPKEKPTKTKDALKFDHLPPSVLKEDYDPSNVDVWSWAVFVCLLLHKQTPFDMKSSQSVEEQWNQYSTKYQFTPEAKKLLDRIFRPDGKSEPISSYDILQDKWLAEKKKMKKS